MYAMPKPAPMVAVQLCVKLYTVLPSLRLHGVAEEQFPPMVRVEGLVQVAAKSFNCETMAAPPCRVHAFAAVHT